MRKNEKNPKIAFIVLTNELVDQQKKLIDKYLSNMVTSKGFGGLDSEQLTLNAISSVDVFVTPAEILA